MFSCGHDTGRQPGSDDRPKVLFIQEDHQPAAGPKKPIKVVVDPPRTTAIDDNGEELSPTPSPVPRPNATVRTTRR